MADYSPSGQPGVGPDEDRDAAVAARAAYSPSAQPAVGEGPQQPDRPPQPDVGVRPIWPASNPVGTQKITIMDKAWKNIKDFSQAVDQAAGFDTTASYGYKPPARSEQPWASVIGDAANKIAGITGAVKTGLSFGLAPRLDSATGQNAYQPVEERFAQRHPELQTGGEIVGSIPTAVVGEGALTKVIPPALGTSLISRGLDITGQAIRGGIIGGTAGAGMNRDDPTTGAVEGAVVGAGIPGLMGALKLLTKPMVDSVSARLIPGEAERQARAKIAEAFTRDATTGKPPTAEELKAALDALGPQGALVDVGPPGGNVTGLGAGVANVPGNAKGIATQFLEGRMEGAPTRINAAINAATGNPAEFNATMDNLSNLRRTQAGPKYEAAFDRIIPTQAEVDRVGMAINDPIGQAALDKGMRIIQLEKVADKQPFNMADYGVTRNSDGKYVLGDGTPNLRLLDAVKRGYDGIVESYRNPITKELNLDQEGRAINSVRAGYVKDLRDMYQRYGAALDAWSGPSQSMDAINMGRKVLNNDPEVTAKMIAGLSDSDKDFFRAGVARALKDRVDATQEGADATRKIFGNTLVRGKVAAAFDDPAQFEQFRTVMENENTFAQTRNAVLKGSRTAPLGANMQDVDYSAPAALAVSGHPVAGALSVLRQVGAQGANPLDTHPVRTEIARQLFSGGQDNEYFRALRAVQDRQFSPYARVPFGIAGAVEASQPSDEQRKRRAGQGLLNQ